MSRAPATPRVAGRTDACADCGAPLRFTVHRATGATVTACPNGCPAAREVSGTFRPDALALEAGRPPRLRQQLAALTGAVSEKLERADTHARPVRTYRGTPRTLPCATPGCAGVVHYAGTGQRASQCDACVSPVARARRLRRAFRQSGPL